MQHHRNFSLEDIVCEIDGVTYAEEWKPIEGCEHTHLISSFGRIKRLPGFRRGAKDKILSAAKTKKGYLRISLLFGGKKKWKYIHRLVAQTFIPSISEKPCVNHKTGDKFKNHYSQLEWCTNEENNQHARKMGLFDGANSKIPKEQRRFIKDNFFTIGRKSLADMFGLTEEYVLEVAKVKVNGTNQRKKINPTYKKVVDTHTGMVYSTEELAKLLGIKRRYVARMLNEERKPNTSVYRYV